MNEIEKFIKGFSEFGESVVRCFTKGNCYWFAYILHTRFSDSRIVINNLENHFACQIENDIYDITGKCTDTYIGTWEDWESYQRLDSAHSKCIIDCCVNKVR